MFEHLISRFASAGLKLVLTDVPFVGRVTGRSQPEIVQIDIQRKVKGNLRYEWFRIYPGHENNRIEVLGIDKGIGQLVLMVHEPVRTFEEQAAWSVVNRLKDQDPVNWLDLFCKENNLRKNQVKVERGGQVWVLRKTSDQKRHFLLGLDERQLFIAQLPNPATTVRQAHTNLKTSSVTLAEGKVGASRRQGEWFFIPATQEEADRIEDNLRRNKLKLERQVPIAAFSGGIRGPKPRQSVGKPHTAEELVLLPGIPVEGGRWPVRSTEIFVRGKIRHEDHKTVKFTNWRKVIRNAEPNVGQAIGVGWID
jgi:hypothetical protein